jgi:hypothetical protein
MALAIVALGLPWGTHVAYAAEAPVLTSAWLETAAGTTTTVNEGQAFQVKGTFTDGDSSDLHYAQIKIGSAFVETLSGLPSGARTFSVSKLYPDDSPSGTPQDTFTLTVKISDSAGLVSNTWSTIVTVRNVAPAVTSFVLAPSSILDHETVQASGAFTDASAKDTFTLAVDWGDGSAAFTRSYVSADPKTFAAAHEYVVAGNYTPTVTVTDDDTGVGTLASVLGVASRNRPPTDLLLAGTGVTEGDVATIDGSFTDPDTADTHTVRMVWGDGSTSDLALDAGVTTFAATHTYSNDGTYLITATVTDPASAETTSVMSFMVFKRNHAPADLVLSTTDAVEGGTGKLNVQFSDPDPLDWHRVRVGWGDSSPATEHLLDAGVFSLEAAHLYSAAGTYTLTVVVVDTFDSAVDGTADLEVRVRTTGEVVDEIAGLVLSWDLDAGLQNSLLAKVRAAQVELGWGRVNVCNSLGALANHVSAQTGKKLSTDDVDAFWSLMADVNTGTECAQLYTPEVQAAELRSGRSDAEHGSAKDKAPKEHGKSKKG